MNEAQHAIEASLAELDRLRRSIKKGSSAQVQSSEERSIIKANALSWFNKHRVFVVLSVPDTALSTIDSIYRELLSCGDKNTTRRRYYSILKNAHDSLIELRDQNIVNLSNVKPQQSSDTLPSFTSLTPDLEMRAILTRRWNECATCISSQAPLAATVMMGGLIEGLLLARINQFIDKSKVFKSNSAPKGKSSGKTLTLNEWTLKNYIDVAHELGWISQTEKDLGIVLRDYRNYIHPHKERSHGIKLEPKDAALLWELSKSIARQLLAVSGSP